MWFVFAWSAALAARTPGPFELPENVRWRAPSALCRRVRYAALSSSSRCSTTWSTAVRVLAAGCDGRAARDARRAPRV